MADVAAESLCRIGKKLKPETVAQIAVSLKSDEARERACTAQALGIGGTAAVEFAGMPEAQINLAQATTYLSCAPKSNASYMALLTALEDVRRLPAYPVPLHLRNAPTQLMKELGYGEGYKYAHDYEGNVVEPKDEVVGERSEAESQRMRQLEAEQSEQEYLPEELKDKIYYRPT